MSLADAFWFQEGPGVRNWQFTKEGVKLLNVANIEKSGTLNLAKTERHLDKAEVEKKYSHFLVDSGDLVIASSGISFDDDGLLRTRGAFVEKKDLPLCLNTSTIRFKAIGDKSDLHFLRHWLDGYEFRSQITKLVTGTAQQNFGPSHLKATKISLPPLTDQRRIAAILDQADVLRSKRRNALTQLDTLTQSIFLSLFGDPRDNKKKQQLVPLGELCHKLVDGTHKTPTYTSSGIPFVTVRNMGTGTLNLSGTKFITKDEHALLTRRVKPERGDVLVSKDGTIGIACPVETDQEFSIFVSVALLKLKHDLIDQLFLIGQFRTDWIQSQIRAGTKGIAIRHLHLNDFKKLRILLPPISLQEDFVCRVSAVDRLRNRYVASMAEIDALFASLQHRAFRGEL